jgi:hypothetical protein|tara:strand:+ start:357 stop:653 length:297 start_codon:yes stop_codon:yes gene_type:complete
MEQFDGKAVRRWDGTAMQYGLVSSSRTDESGTIQLQVSWLSEDSGELLDSPGECARESVELFNIEKFMYCLNFLATQCTPPTSFLHALRKERSEKYAL